MYWPAGRAARRTVVKVISQLSAEPLAALIADCGGRPHQFLIRSDVVLIRDDSRNPRNLMSHREPHKLVRIVRKLGIMRPKLLTNVETIQPVRLHPRSHRVGGSRRVQPFGGRVLRTSERSD